VRHIGRARSPRKESAGLPQCAHTHATLRRDAQSGLFMCQESTLALTYFTSSRGASTSDGLSARSHLEQIARTGPTRVGFPGPRWCTSLRLTSCRTAVTRAGRSVCRCLEWPQAVSGCHRRRDLNQPSGWLRVLLAVALRASCGKRAPRGPEAAWRSGDRSPREMN
jgi:hypothetical protein